MHRIDADDDDGLFKKTPAPATILTPEWTNDVQENLARLIEAAGITLVKGDYGQLTAAIRALSVPVGSVTAYAADDAPTGWLICDGAEYLIDDYPDLAEVLGATWGVATATYFKVPDMRARAAMGADNELGADAALTLGSYADSQNKAHTHQWLKGAGGGGDTDVPEGTHGFSGMDSNSGLVSATTHIANQGATHGRPRAAVFNWIIRT